MSYQEDKLTEIADAIRYVRGAPYTDPIKASEFAEIIENLVCFYVHGIPSIRRGASMYQLSAKVEQIRNGVVIDLKPLIVDSITFRFNAFGSSAKIGDIIKITNTHYTDTPMYIFSTRHGGPIYGTKIMKNQSKSYTIDTYNMTFAIYQDNS